MVEVNVKFWVRKEMKNDNEPHKNKMITMDISRKILLIEND